MNPTQKQFSVTGVSLKRKFLSVVILSSCSLALAADKVAEFSSGAEGWQTASYVEDHGPFLPKNITASNATPATANGYLHVQDLDNNWQWAVAPAEFLGDWSHFGSLKVGLITDDANTVYRIMLYLTDHVQGNASNAAFAEFPVAGTPGSSRLDLSMPLTQARWTMVMGSWSNLIANVQQFWIRLDLNSNVAGELELLDYVMLIDAFDTTVRTYSGLELLVLTETNLLCQWQQSPSWTQWKNLGSPVQGRQPLYYTIGDQPHMFFRSTQPVQLSARLGTVAEFLAPLGVHCQLQFSLDAAAWSDYGGPFVGDGSIQNRFLLRTNGASPQLRLVTSP